MSFPILRKAPQEAPRPAAERAQALAQRVAARAAQAQGQPEAPPAAPPPEPAHAPARPAPPPDNRVEVLAQQVADVGARLQALAGAVDALRQETGAIGQRLKEGDEKFVRLLALLEGVQASDNPFVDRGNLHEGATPAALRAHEALAAGPAAPAAGLAGAASQGPLPQGLPSQGLPPQGQGQGAEPRAPPAAWGLEHSVLLLEWADMLLEAVDREALPHLLDWYEGLGWLDRPLKERVLGTARGIHANADEPELKALEAPSGRARRSAPAPAQPPPWRQSLEVHLRSLAFITRLRGLPDESPERLEEAVRKALAIRAG